MSLRGWVRESRTRATEDGLPSALVWSATELTAGVGRKTVGRCGPGTTIWEREWDVLCVLDGCRPDLLTHVADEYDWLRSVDRTHSVASASAAWMERTFAPEYGDEMARTAYITANPFSGHADGDENNLPLSTSDFAVLSEVWREGDPVAGGATPPRPLTDRAVHTWRNREELGVDRLIVHYMQPHEPFLSDPAVCSGEGSVWQRYRGGDRYTRARILDGYADNLRAVLDDVALFRENCTAAEFVLTADHGNALGEWNVYGHRHGVRTEAVRGVPWAGVAAIDEGDHQPAVTVDAEVSQPHDGVEDRLADLGYVDV
jgi:hypothetical protein